MYDFVEYIRTMDLYALIDAIVLIAAVALLVVLFAYRRNLRVLVMLLSVALLEVLVLVLSELSDHEILTVSRYILHYAMITFIVITAVVYQSDLKAIFQKIANPKGLSVFNDNLNSDDELRETTAEILSACQNMAKQDVGAIIIIDSNNSINDNSARLCLKAFSTPKRLCTTERLSSAATRSLRRVVSCRSLNVTSTRKWAPVTVPLSV